MHAGRGRCIQRQTGSGKLGQAEAGR
jgi:hypothetical protein